MISEDYKLIWSDEFLGQFGEKPSDEHWKFDVGGNGWGNRELQYYTDSRLNSFITGDGKLVLRARRLTQPGYKCWYGPCHYTSARLSTKNNFSFQYGLLETKVKFPKGTGVWGAIWLLGNASDQTSWPENGEIDIVEYLWRSPNSIFCGLHGPDYSHLENNHILQEYCNDSIFFSDSYNKFAVRWNENGVSWFLNGKNYFSILNTDIINNKKRWVFNKPFHIIINLAIGGRWPGYPETENSDSDIWQKDMTIDYVRVYKETTVFEEVVNYSYGENNHEI